MQEARDRAIPCARFTHRFGNRGNARFARRFGAATVRPGRAFGLRRARGACFALFGRLFLRRSLVTIRSATALAFTRLAFLAALVPT